MVNVCREYENHETNFVVYKKATVSLKYVNKCNLGTKMRPVSYTHLDVYKRQVWLL